MAKVSNFIPKKGVNKAVKELREKASNSMAKGIESKASSTYKAKLNAVHDKMKDRIHLGDNNLVDVIEKSTGIQRPRNIDGTVKKSARKSANVFNQNIDKIKEVEEIADMKINSEKIGNAIGKMRDNRIANEMAESYRGQGNKANRRIEQMRAKQVHDGKRLSIQKQLDAAADAEDLEKMISLQKQLDDLGEYKAPGPKKTFQERKAERIEKYENTKIAKEMEGSFGDIEHTRPTNKKTATPQSETSPSGGNASIMQQAQDKIKGNNFVYNMAAMGVGGGLVLNMANNKGQQSNAQLYGQY